MREQILNALKAKFKGVNANILGRIADMLAKTVTTEDQVQPAVDGVSQGLIDVIEAYGDSRATDAQKTAVQNYETKHGLKDGVKVVVGKPAGDGTKKPEEDTVTPDWASIILFKMVCLHFTTTFFPSTM